MATFSPYVRVLMQKKINALTFFCTKFRQRKLLFCTVSRHGASYCVDCPRYLNSAHCQKHASSSDPDAPAKQRCNACSRIVGVCLGMAETIVSLTSLALFIRPIEAPRASSANTRSQSAPSADADQWLSSKPSDQPSLWRPKAPTQSCYPCGMQQAH